MQTSCAGADRRPGSWTPPAGKIVTPGFFDGHPHMDRQGLKARGGVPLEGCSSVAEIVERVREAVARTPRDSGSSPCRWGRRPTTYVCSARAAAEGRFPNQAGPRCRIARPSRLHPRAVGLVEPSPVPVGRQHPGPEERRRHASLPPSSLQHANARRRLRASRPACSSIATMRRLWSTPSSSACRASPTRIVLPACGSAVRAYSAVGTTAAYEGHGAHPSAAGCLSGSCTPAA